jgi:hypothetical protein
MTKGLKGAMVTVAGITALGLASVPVAGAPPDRDHDRLPQGAQRVRLDPADFTTRIDNRYWPMAPGTQWVYRHTEPDGTEQRVEVVVTDRIRRVAGIDARVVHDVVTEDGELREVTDDWYAQDDDGNVWYLGEATQEYENGEVVSTAGSFEAGVDGAQAGIAMPGRPRLRLRYRQEYYAGQAEDAAEILSLHEQAEVPFGHFTDVLVTKDTTPLQPRVLEYKHYAPGVGPVLILGVSGGSAREELVSFTRGR